MRPEIEDTELSALLRHGDPADDGSALSRHESARLRSLVLSAPRGASPARWIPLAASAAAAILAAVLLVPAAPPPAATSPVATRGSERQPMSHRATADTTPTDGAPADGARRQIRFATERGTQIIWILDPDVQL